MPPFELRERLDQRLRARSARRTRRSTRARQGPVARHGRRRFLSRLCHCTPPAPAATAAKSARILVWSFSPGAASTPDEISIAAGRTCATASPTFSAVSPPASTIGRVRGTAAAASQSIRRRCRPGAPVVRISSTMCRGHRSSPNARPSASSGTALITGGQGPGHRWFLLAVQLHGTETARTRQSPRRRRPAD